MPISQGSRFTTAAEASTVAPPEAAVRPSKTATPVAQVRADLVRVIAAPKMSAAFVVAASPFSPRSRHRELAAAASVGHTAWTKRSPAMRTEGVSVNAAAVTACGRELA